MQIFVLLCWGKDNEIHEPDAYIFDNEEEALKEKNRFELERWINKSSLLKFEMTERVSFQFSKPNE